MCIWYALVYSIYINQHYKVRNPIKQKIWTNSSDKECEKAEAGRIGNIKPKYVRTICCLQETYFRLKDTNGLKVE